MTYQMKIIKRMYESKKKEYNNLNYEVFIKNKKKYLHINKIFNSN